IAFPMRRAKTDILVDFPFADSDFPEHLHEDISKNLRNALNNEVAGYSTSISEYLFFVHRLFDIGYGSKMKHNVERSVRSVLKKYPMCTNKDLEDILHLFMYEITELEERQTQIRFNLFRKPITFEKAEAGYV